MVKQGVLLLNLGTPEGSDAASVRRYLSVFLNDPRVIDLPTVLRWVLSRLIVWVRHRKSAHAYQQIWTAEGSPLLVYSIAIKQALAQKLGQDYQVELGMRYGKPSIPEALEKLKLCPSIRVLPLFPQYSSAATGSAIQAFLASLAKQDVIPHFSVQSDFYAHPGFIGAYAAQIKTSLDATKVEKIIFSFHGLPERHLRGRSCGLACDMKQACPAMQLENAYCYRAQCYETARLLAGALNFSSQDYEVAFQSRLGRTPWIQPYTDYLLQDLREQGLTRIAVACPSFVADCLETLEEIGMRLSDQWKSLGGLELKLIPCLNAHPLWIETLAAFVSPSEEQRP